MAFRVEHANAGSQGVGGNGFFQIVMTDEGFDVGMKRSSASDG